MGLGEGQGRRQSEAKGLGGGKCLPCLFSIMGRKCRDLLVFPPLFDPSPLQRTLATTNSHEESNRIIDSPSCVSQRAQNGGRRELANNVSAYGEDGKIVDF